MLVIFTFCKPYHYANKPTSTVMARGEEVLWINEDKLEAEARIVGIENMVLVKEVD